jgi:DNA-directed RNA polymerase specialized sigma subunit
MAKEPDTLLEPEFEEPYKAWKATPSPVTAGALLKAVKPVLQSGLKTYGGTEAASPNLASKARQIALGAFDKYDPNRAKLRTHLMVHLQGLRRQSADESQPIRLPDRVSLDLHRLHFATNELKDRLGRDPSDAELADHSGLSYKRLTHLRKVMPTHSEGVYTQSDSEGEPGSAPAVVPQNGDEHWLHFVYGDLDPNDQLIMEHTLGMHGKPIKSKQWIAGRLGLSPGAISQRAAHIQSLLDKREELGGLI